MAFASMDDARVHLPLDKLELEQADFDRIELDTERIIRGYVSGFLNRLTIAGWTDPTQTDPTHAGYVPELIRAIAGRFIAAFYYKERYSEDSLDIPQYAQDKYNEAMALLTQLIAGTITLYDVTELATEGDFSADDFYPNSKDKKGPMFSIDDHFFSTPPIGGR